MLRSMFTAISSLVLHQNYLDVVANNLANSNTIGFKSNRVMFQDQFYQMMNPGSGPSATQGGTNPTQIGLGLQMGNISTVFTQGMLQSTGRNMDLAIQGDGFFVYGKADGRRYSREGSLTLDSTGFLVNSSSGQRIQGWSSPSGVIDSTLPPDDIQIQQNSMMARATGKASMAGNLSSNAPVAPAADSSTTATVGVYDSLGNLTTATVRYTHTAHTATNDTWTMDVIDPTKTPPVALPGASVTGGAMVFDVNGQYVPASSSATTSVTLPPSAGTANGQPVTFGMDLSKITQLATDSNVSLQSQDGLPSGSVSDVFITPKDGGIFLVYSNGMRRQVGQLAMASFTNPSGLMRDGHSSFQQGINSGEAQIGAAGSGGRGVFAAGYLEASNVDMAQEFTNMILAQRGFQASSKVITTSDEIMQELVNLKR